MARDQDRRLVNAMIREELNRARQQVGLRRLDHLGPQRYLPDQDAPVPPLTGGLTRAKRRAPNRGRGAGSPANSANPPREVIR
jgi:hypothetical protein